jgi:acetate kinase
MDDYALVLNAGSSSLKYAVFQRPPGEEWMVPARGQVDGLGSTPRFRASDRAGTLIAEETLDSSVKDGSSALEYLAQWLRNRFGPARLLGVGHRVVHGGARFAGPVVVTPQILEELKALIPLAPLHQPHNLAAIETVAARLPGVPQVACFDTSFHRGQSAVAEVVPLPLEVREKGVQRYGFHGLSYEFIALMLPMVAPDIARSRVIVAHLGSGASLCAMNGGKSVDSTFGFTALDGLCMGTRPGTIDPGVVLFLVQQLGLSASEIEAMLYKRSGLLGLSGISSDMRVLAKNPDPPAQLAVEYFVYQAVKQIGALTAVLGGLDGLVFTAGIGENSPEIRRRICEGCRWIGVELDNEANDHNRARISVRKSRVATWVIPTNEELMIARHTGELLGLIEARA